MVEHGASAEDKKPLINIASSTVAPDEVQMNLCSLRKNGYRKMQALITKRLMSQAKDFFAPIPKVVLTIFSTMSKSFTTTGLKSQFCYAQSNFVH